MVHLSEHGNRAKAIIVAQPTETDRALCRVSLRAATELFSARIDQLCQFIYDHGLEPPPMNPDDESGINRVLDTLQIPRGLAKKRDVGAPLENGPAQPAQPIHTPPPLPPVEESLGGTSAAATGVTSSQQNAPHAQSTLPPVVSSPEQPAPLGISPGLAFPNPSTHWGFTLPTAESLDTIYANINGRPNSAHENSLSPDSLQLTQDMQRQPGVLLEQGLQYKDDDSDSGEEDEAEKDVIEQISHRIGTLKIAGDGHLRFYGATSNLNLVDVSATQQRQRPDARTVRHDGQDILNHLRVGQAVDEALENHLVELYFTWQNTSTYVVDKEMFMIARAKWRNELDDTPFYSEVLTNAMYDPT